MAWIKVIAESDTSTELNNVYQRIQKKRGKLSNIMRVHSLKPGAMRAHLDLYLSVMFDQSSLRRELKEMIAVVVSQLNGCQYCVQHHSGALQHYWKNQKKIERFREDFESVNLLPQEKKILQYAKKLTREPQSMVEEDVEALKELGLDDQEILEIALIVSYFNFVNRIASGLGVEMTDKEIKGYKY
jgi:uncharacterized peroxidase-related enzyme